MSRFDTRRPEEKLYPHAVVEKSTCGLYFTIRVGNGDRIITGLTREQANDTYEALLYMAAHSVKNTKKNIRLALGLDN